MTDGKPPDNLRIWKLLSETPPEHTEDYTGAGGFRGTQYKPNFMYERLTALFGPAGLGWGWHVEDCGETDGAGFEVGGVLGHERVHTVLVRAWVVIDGRELKLPPQYGCTTSVVYRAPNQKRGYPARWETIVDARKMSVTDGVSKSFQALGMIADILQGRHKKGGSRPQRPPQATNAPPPGRGGAAGQGRSSVGEDPAASTAAQWENAEPGEKLPPLGKPLGALVENHLAAGRKRDAMAVLQAAWNRAEDEDADVISDKQRGYFFAMAKEAGMPKEEIDVLLGSLFGCKLSELLRPVFDGVLAVLAAKKEG